MDMSIGPIGFLKKKGQHCVHLGVLALSVIKDISADSA
jgi:hypothetical protein